MSYRDHLQKQLDAILAKQEEIKINENLNRICKELDGFTEKIKTCLENDTELSESDEQRIKELNDQYNTSIDLFKKLKNLK